MERYVVTRIGDVTIQRVVPKDELPEDEGEDDEEEPESEKTEMEPTTLMPDPERVAQLFGDPPDEDEESVDNEVFERLESVGGEVASVMDSSELLMNIKDEPMDEDNPIDSEEKGDDDKDEESSKRKQESDDEESGNKKKKQEDETETDKKKALNMRRNIREVMDEAQLDEATLAAQRQEMERLRRVQDQQKYLRDVQRQMQINRQNLKTQSRVMSFLQGNSSTSLIKARTSPTSLPPSKPSTVLVKVGSDAPPQALNKKVLESLRVERDSPPLQQQRLIAPKLIGKPHMVTPSVTIAPVKPASLHEQIREKKDVVTISSSDDDDIHEERISSLVKDEIRGSTGVQTAESRLSEDDDCIVISEPSDEEDENDVDPTNSGMHTNDLFNTPDEQGRVLINLGKQDGEAEIFLAPQIARIIKPHQIGGVRFLFDNVVESVERFNNSTGFGCILAHSMGLGKTLQVVSFCDVFLRETPAKTVMCIMPINTLQNWMAEFNLWLPTDPSSTPLAAQGEVRPRHFKIYVLNDLHKTIAARARVVQEWRREGGVLLIGYEMYRQLSLKRPGRMRKSKKKQPEEDVEDDKNKPLLEDMHDALVKPGPDLVICDEGHRIKNSHASISHALKQIRTKRRVVLTGYPLQNNLLEYWCMVDFVRPNYLGTKTEFSNMFERPIQNGQCIDSTPQDIRLMRYRAHVLHSLLEGFVQRRSHSVLRTSLPQKEEYVILVRLNTFQRKLYDTFMNEVVRTKAVPNPLKAFAVCCKIWNHPDILYNFLKKREMDELQDLDIDETAAINQPGQETTSPRGRPKEKKGKGKKAQAVATPIKAPAVAAVPPTTSLPEIKQEPNFNQNFNDFNQYGNFNNQPTNFPDQQPQQQQQQQQQQPQQQQNSSYNYNYNNYQYNNYPGQQYNSNANQNYSEYNNYNNFYQQGNNYDGNNYYPQIKQEPVEVKNEDKKEDVLKQTFCRGLSGGEVVYKYPNSQYDDKSQLKEGFQGNYNFQQYGQNFQQQGPSNYNWNQEQQVQKDIKKTPEKKTKGKKGKKAQAKNQQQPPQEFNYPNQEIVNIKKEAGSQMDFQKNRQYEMYPQQIDHNSPEKARVAESSNFQGSHYQINQGEHQVYSQKHMQNQVGNQEMSHAYGGQTVNTNSQNSGSQYNQNQTMPQNYNNMPAYNRVSNEYPVMSQESQNPNNVHKGSNVSMYPCQPLAQGNQHTNYPQQNNQTTGFNTQQASAQNYGTNMQINPNNIVDQNYMHMAGAEPPINQGINVPKALSSNGDNISGIQSNTQNMHLNTSGQNMPMHSTAQNMMNPNSQNMQINPNQQSMQGNPNIQNMQMNPSTQNMQMNPSGQNLQMNPSGQTMLMNPSGQNMQMNSSSPGMQMNSNGQNLPMNSSAQNMQMNPSSQNMHMNPGGQNMQMNQSPQNMQMNPNVQNMQMNPNGQSMQMNPSGQNMQMNPGVQGMPLPPSGPSLHLNQNSQGMGASTNASNSAGHNMSMINTAQGVSQNAHMNPSHNTHPTMNSQMNTNSQMLSDSHHLQASHYQSGTNMNQNSQLKMQTNQNYNMNQQNKTQQISHTPSTAIKSSHMPHQSDSSHTKHYNNPSQQSGQNYNMQQNQANYNMQMTSSQQKNDSHIGYNQDNQYSSQSSQSSQSQNYIQSQYNPQYKQNQLQGQTNQAKINGHESQNFNQKTPPYDNQKSLNYDNQYYNQNYGEYSQYNRQYSDQYNQPGPSNFPFKFPEEPVKEKRGMSCQTDPVDKDDIIFNKAETEKRCFEQWDKEEGKLDKDDDKERIEEEEKEKKIEPIKSGKEEPGIPYDWATELLKGYVPGDIHASAKMSVFFCILEESIALGDRILVFSQSLFTLNLMEELLQQQFVNGKQEKWARNVNYYRLDGSTAAIEREKLINEFNSNPNLHLFLVSTRAGSLGINLVGANRVIVFDASWNPCHDTQAVCRVYRYGQKKPCFVYRLVTDNCLEKKIYDRQINKQGMSDRVVDECNPDAHLSIKEVTSLCWDDKEDDTPRDFTNIQDNYIDVVIQKILQRHSTLLSKAPFQHESLLVDRKEKKLSLAEKRLAKRSYELEKQASNSSTRPMYYNNSVSPQGGPFKGQEKPMASVRPMQSEMQLARDSQRPRGWIPASVWQRQGMSAQEMTLPLDVVIPTNAPDRSSIVLKAGQKVMVLKSPKGIYMQLENGKIIAIRTSLKNVPKDKPEPKKPLDPSRGRGVVPNMPRNSNVSITPSRPLVGRPSRPIRAVGPVSRPPASVTVTRRRISGESGESDDELGDMAYRKEDKDYHSVGTSAQMFPPPPPAPPAPSGSAMHAPSLGPDVSISAYRPETASFKPISSNRQDDYHSAFQHPSPSEQKSTEKSFQPYYYPPSSYYKPPSYDYPPPAPNPFTAAAVASSRSSFDTTYYPPPFYPHNPQYGWHNNQPPPNPPQQ